MKLTIATRKSPLALWQAEHVKTLLQQAHPQVVVELLALQTSGDRFLQAPLATQGGKGLFVKELEEALLAEHADIAVHSMKDMPVQIPDDLLIAAILARHDPRDALISPSGATLLQLPAGSTIGTSSLRRQCQLLALRPDLHIAALRGNINTRLHKCENGEFSAIVLAAAGLARIELTHAITEYLAPPQFIPAVGQGAIGIECRRNDARTQHLLAPLHDTQTALCVNAERAMNQQLNGGCQAPIAAYATIVGKNMTLIGLVGEKNGQTLLRTQVQGPLTQALALGAQAAQELIAQGAQAILLR